LHFLLRFSSHLLFRDTSLIFAAIIRAAVDTLVRIANLLDAASACELNWPLISLQTQNI
jgi:hypothetical protein